MTSIGTFLACVRVSVFDQSVHSPCHWAPTPDPLLSMFPSRRSAPEARPCAVDRAQGGLCHQLCHHR
jgi:hypothetical protein